MDQRDLARWDDGVRLDTDVCIVGGGPAGISLAAELAHTRVRVCLLEGGGADREPETQALYRFESVGAGWKGDAERRVRALSGSSMTWAGRCAPLDSIDFRARSWVPHSGWPIGRRDLDPPLERAGALLGLGPQRYDESLFQRFGVAPPSPALDPALLRQQIWQYSRGKSSPHEPVRFADDVLAGLRDSSSLTLVLHANVTRIDTEGGRVTGVSASSLNGKRLSVRAKVVVLACGAIENARLLLASADGGLGNEHDLVGRYLMDHPSPVVATFPPHAADSLLHRFGRYRLEDASGIHTYLVGAALSERAQMSKGLLNCTASLLAEPRADAAMVALRRLARAGGSVPEARAIVRDVFHVARAPSELASAVVRRAMGRPPRADIASLALICHPEQLPDPASRVMLASDRDALGVPIVRIDWRVHELERDTVLATFDLLRRELARLGLPAPRPASWMRGDEDWRPAFTDAGHPMGTTRMHDDPRAGVVDSTAKVHGVEGLYAAGPSVMPTSGAGAPMLTIVALSVRLGAHLKRELHAARTPEVSGAHAHAPERVRVGIVGAGPRVESVYFPILSALSSRFEVAGMTSRDADTCERVAARTGARAFRTPEELVERASPDFVIVCEPNEPHGALCGPLIDHGVRLLIEAPLARSLREARALVRRIERRGVPVGVAEAMPFLPLEELKAALREAGVFGRVLAAHNDLHSADHHGIAQLRRYLGCDRRPREASATFGSIPLAKSGEPMLERWTTGSVRYDDGAMLYQQLGVGASPILGRIPGSLRIHGEHASMLGAEVRMSGATARVERHEDKETRALAALSIALPGIGRITWENPEREIPLSDEQLAVAAHLESMRRVALGQGEPLYPAAEALGDVEILRAMELSAQRGGAPVSLPIKLAIEGARVLARPSTWRGRALR